MNQEKIGQFIASCRKAKEMTQKELAEKLNVSDKSVSKWERGINLPDVSLYMPLCEELDISINELFAGEYIQAEAIIQKSEENILTIVEDDYKKTKKLDRIHKVVVIIALLSVPFIILQWNLKFIWTIVELESHAYDYVYFISVLYFLAYFLVYKKIRLGYYMMWILFILLFCIDISLLGYQSELLTFSVDLWMNIFITVVSIINNDFRLGNLMKKI